MLNAERFIPFNVPLIGREEVEAVTRVLESGWLTTGPVTERFEREFRSYVGAPHALAVNSCTAGLHLALAALKVGPGDEVITTPLTFCATVNSILRVGAKPVLADIGPDLNLDPDRVEAVLSERTRAVLPVHFAGLPCNMLAIRDIARRHELAVVEDAAHAVGARYDGVRIGGGESQAVVFSFYPTKNMTTGEGGMITTASAELDDRMRVLCLHGMSKQAWSRYSAKGSWAYDVVDCGFKYNLTDVAAAIGICQLARLDAMTERRREIAAAYTAEFAGLTEIETPPAGASGHAWHLYVLRLNLDRLEIDRAEFIEQLRDRGVGASVHFIPIPLHSYYQRVLEFRDACARALAEYPRMLSLPLHPRLSGADVQRVAGAVRDIITRNRKRRVFAAGAA